MKFSIIAAMDTHRGIGMQNRLPWRLKGDLKHFSDVTTATQEGFRNAVIMGRKTWESLPENSRPLKNRLNVVLSRSPQKLPEDVIGAASLDEAFEKLREKQGPASRGGLTLDRIFVIGGANLYAQAVVHPDCEKLYITEVLAEFPCDAFFPEIPAGFIKKEISETHEENGISYRFTVYENGIIAT